MSKDEKSNTAAVQLPDDDELDDWCVEELCREKFALT